LYLVKFFVSLQNIDKNDEKNSFDDNDHDGYESDAGSGFAVPQGREGRHGG
jgi:hypothetical protein